MIAALLSSKPPVQCHNPIKYHSTNHIHATVVILLAATNSVHCKLLRTANCCELQIAAYVIVPDPPTPLSRESGTETGDIHHNLSIMTRSSLPV